MIQRMNKHHIIYLIIESNPKSGYERCIRLASSKEYIDMELYKINVNKAIERARFYQCETKPYIRRSIMPWIDFDYNIMKLADNGYDGWDYV